MYEKIQSTFLKKKKKKKKKIFGVKEMAKFYSSLPKLWSLVAKNVKRQQVRTRKKKAVTLSKIHKVKEKRGFQRREDQINTAYEK